MARLALSALHGKQDRFVIRRLTILLAFSGCVSVSLAHPNATRVGNAVRTACGSLTSNSLCSDVFGFTDEEASELAPDKLVMQSVAALGTIRKQISLVNRRLDQLRLSNSGASRVGFSGSLRPSGSPPVIATSQRQASLVTPRASTRTSNPGRPLLIASTYASLPDILLAQGLAQDTAPATGSSSATNAGSTAFPSNDLGLYFRVEGNRGDSDANTFDPGFRFRTAGLTVGGDYKVSANAVLGGSLGYNDNRSTLDTTDGTPSGNVKTRGTSVSLYGAYYPTATAYVDATLLYGRNRYESIRNMPALTDSAIGSTAGDQYGLSLGGGYSFLTSNFNVGPYARVSWSKAEVDAFTERVNDTSSNLAVQAQTAESVVSVLGGQISYAISRNWGVLVPNARVEWEHQHKDDRTRNIVATFAQDPAGSINIETTPPDRSYFNLGLGLASHFGVGRSAFVYYETLLGKEGTKNNALTVELRLEF